MNKIKQILAVLVLAGAGNSWSQIVTLLDNTFAYDPVNMNNFLPSWWIGISDGGYPLLSLPNSRPLYRTYELGHSFVTGPNSVNNLSVNPWFVYGYDHHLVAPGASFSIALHSDLNNQPNTLLGYFSGSTEPLQGTSNSYSLDPNYVLSANTKYWLVERNSGEPDAVYGANLIAIGHAGLSPQDSSNYGFSVGDVGLFVNGEWEIVHYANTIHDPTTAVVYSLSGSIVPEPSSLSLLLAGGAVLMAGRRRKSD